MGRNPVSSLCRPVQAALRKIKKSVSDRKGKRQSKLVEAGEYDRSDIGISPAVGYPSSTLEEETGEEQAGSDENVNFTTKDHLVSISFLTDGNNTSTKYLVYDKEGDEKDGPIITFNKECPAGLYPEVVKNWKKYGKFKKLSPLTSSDGGKLQKNRNLFLHQVLRSLEKDKFHEALREMQKMGKEYLAKNWQVQMDYGNMHYIIPCNTCDGKYQKEEIAKKLEELEIQAGANNSTGINTSQSEVRAIRDTMEVTGTLPAISQQVASSSSIEATRESIAPSAVSNDTCLTYSSHPVVSLANCSQLNADELALTDTVKGEDQKESSVMEALTVTDCEVADLFQIGEVAPTPVQQPSVSRVQMAYENSLPSLILSNACLSSSPPLGVLPASWSETNSLEQAPTDSVLQIERSETCALSQQRPTTSSETPGVQLYNTEMEEAEVWLVEVHAAQQMQQSSTSQLPAVPMLLAVASQVTNDQEFPQVVEVTPREFMPAVSGSTEDNVMRKSELCVSSDLTHLKHAVLDEERKNGTWGEEQLVTPQHYIIDVTVTAEVPTVTYQVGEVVSSELLILVRIRVVLNSGPESVLLSKAALERVLTYQFLLTMLAAVHIFNYCPGGRDSRKTRSVSRDAVMMKTKQDDSKPRAVVSAEKLTLPMCSTQYQQTALAKKVFPPPALPDPHHQNALDAGKLVVSTLPNTYQQRATRFQEVMRLPKDEDVDLSQDLPIEETSKLRWPVLSHSRPKINNRLMVPLGKRRKRNFGKRRKKGLKRIILSTSGRQPQSRIKLQSYSRCTSEKNSQQSSSGRRRPTDQGGGGSNGNQCGGGSEPPPQQGGNGCNNSQIQESNQPGTSRGNDREGASGGGGNDRGRRGRHRRRAAPPYVLPRPGGRDHQRPSLQQQAAHQHNNGPQPAEGDVEIQDILQNEPALDPGGRYDVPDAFSPPTVRPVPPEENDSSVQEEPDLEEPWDTFIPVQAQDDSD